MEVAEREKFNNWFTKLLYVEYPAIFRDILRAQKENLWEEWITQHQK